MGWGKVFQNICFYDHNNPKILTLQSVLIVTALRPEASSGTMCVKKRTKIHSTGPQRVLFTCRTSSGASFGTPRSSQFAKCPARAQLWQRGVPPHRQRLPVANVYLQVLLTCPGIPMLNAGSPITSAGLNLLVKPFAPSSPLAT